MTFFRWLDQFPVYGIPKLDLRLLSRIQSCFSRPFPYPIRRLLRRLTKGHLERENCIRPIHTRDFAPGACSKGTLQEQSSVVCTNDFMGILHPREQNFHPAKCSTIFNRLNIWEQAPGAIWANLKTLPRVYWHVQNEPGACSGSKTPRVYRP